MEKENKKGVISSRSLESMKSKSYYQFETAVAINRTFKNKHILNSAMSCCFPFKVSVIAGEDILG